MAGLLRGGGDPDQRGRADGGLDDAVAGFWAALAGWPLEVQRPAFASGLQGGDDDADVAEAFFSVGLQSGAVQDSLGEGDQFWRELVGLLEPAFQGLLAD